MRISDWSSDVCSSDLVLDDVEKEEAPFRQIVVHLLEGVDDQADRVAQPAEDDMLAAEPVFEMGPMLRLGEPVLVDDDEDVIVRHIAFSRLGLIDPLPARDRSLANALQKPAPLPP